MSDLRRSSSYPSDLTEMQWSQLEPLLPAENSVGRHRTVSPRDIANAITYRWETGCAWRMLPHDFPPWGTVYAYFRNWQRAGVLRQMRDILTEAASKSRPKPDRPSNLPSDAASFGSEPRNHSSRNRNPEDHRAAADAEGFSSPKNQAESHPRFSTAERELSGRPAGDIMHERGTADSSLSDRDHGRRPTGAD